MTYGQLDYTYNGCGALTSDSGNGIAMIEYDNSNNPLRIQFTNGNVTRYIYTTTGQKLRTIYYTAMPNITVSIGETRPLSQAEILYTDSIDYLLNGNLILRNGRIDKYMFGEGYCQAWIPHACFARPMMFEGDIFGDGSLIVVPTEEEIESYQELLKRWGEIGAAIQASDDFTFYYYNKDHLGNIREVVDITGTVMQETNYYPFGMPYYDSRSAINPEFQPFKFNGKEFDMMHGLNTLDYGARQYDPVLPIWDKVDPLAEKYYNISPYAYCMNSPVMHIDSDGADPGDRFRYPTQAVMDFGRKYNLASINNNKEYFTYIYKMRDKNGRIYYTYPGPAQGTSHNISKNDMRNVNRNVIKNGILVDIVALAHTHGAWDPKDVVDGIDWNDKFSGEQETARQNMKWMGECENGEYVEDDISGANRTQTYIYVVTPNGSLKGYNPKNGNVVKWSSDMPNWKHADNTNDSLLNTIWNFLMDLLK